MSDAGAPGTGLEALTDGLASLDDAPLQAHPDALEAVHRALVAELDGLAAWGGAESPRA